MNDTDNADQTALAIFEIALSLAKDVRSLEAFGKANAKAIQLLDEPTIKSFRAAYARRLQALRAKT